MASMTKTIPIKLAAQSLGVTVSELIRRYGSVSAVRRAIKSGELSLSPSNTPRVELNEQTEQALHTSVGGRVRLPRHTASTRKAVHVHPLVSFLTKSVKTGTPWLAFNGGLIFATPTPLDLRAVSLQAALQALTAGAQYGDITVGSAQKAASTALATGTLSVNMLGIMLTLATPRDSFTAGPIPGTVAWSGATALNFCLYPRQPETTFVLFPTISTGAGHELRPATSAVVSFADGPKGMVDTKTLLGWRTLSLYDLTVQRGATNCP